MVSMKIHDRVTQTNADTVSLAIHKHGNQFNGKIVSIQCIRTPSDGFSYFLFRLLGLLTLILLHFNRLFILIHHIDTNESMYVTDV